MRNHSFRPVFAILTAAALLGLPLGSVAQTQIAPSASATVSVTGSFTIAAESSLNFGVCVDDLSTSEPNDKICGVNFPAKTVTLTINAANGTATAAPIITIENCPQPNTDPPTTVIGRVITVQTGSTGASTSGSIQIDNGNPQPLNNAVVPPFSKSKTTVCQELQ